MTWERTFAAMTVMHRDQIGSWTNPDEHRRAILKHLGHQITQVLWEHGWSRKELDRPGAAPVVLSMVDSAHDYFIRNLTAVRAECRALDLRTADILPAKMPLWSRRRVP